MKYRCSTKRYCRCFRIPMTMIYHHEDKICVLCKILRVIFKLEIATKRMGPWGGRPREGERDMNIRAKLETIYGTIKTVHTSQENFLMLHMINLHGLSLYWKKLVWKVVLFAVLFRLCSSDVSLQEISVIKRQKVHASFIFFWKWIMEAFNNWASFKNS